MRQRHKMAQLLAAATAAAAPIVACTSVAHAATDVWTGTTTASGTLLFPYPGTTSPVTYAVWDASTQNFATSDGLATPTAYTAGDGVVFNIATGGLIAPTGAVGGTVAPAFMNFSGGTSSTVWTFLRATTTASSSDSAGFNANSGSVVYPSTLYPGVAAGNTTGDSFSASSPFAGSAATTVATNVTLDSTFQGKVILRSRPGGSPSGITEIDGGTLEINDSQALPGKATPTINLGGGTFEININTGRYATGDGNSNPGSTDYRSTTSAMNVLANSTLVNGQVDDNGNSRFLSNAWGATINISGGATLTLATGSEYMALFPETTTASQSSGGILTVGAGYGTISLGTSNGVARFGVAGSGSATNVLAQPFGSTTTDFNAGSGTGAFLASTTQTGAAVSVFNMGGLQGGAGTFVLGSNQATQNAAGLDNYSVGTLNLNETFAGKITNGLGSTTRIVSFTKVGSGTETLADNYFSGPISIADATGSNTGTLRATSARTLTDSTAAVTIGSGGTIDLNGNSPNAGKAFTLAGGSLVNNGTAAVTLGTGTSASITAGTTAGGVYTATAGTSLAGPTISFGTANGGSGATAVALMHLISVGNPATRGAYLVAPVVTVSAPDLPGGRQAIVNALLDKTSGALAFQIADPGFGYESTPTITISGGTLTSANTPAVVSTATLTMAVDTILVTNPSSGYTSAPSLTFTATNGGATQTTTPVGTAGFASVTLTASSNVGGSGRLTINPVIAGGSGFTLTKIGTGTTTLAGANTYAGGTIIGGGTLATDINGVLGTGNVTVGTASVGAALTLGNAASIADTATLKFGDNSTISLNAGAGSSEAVTALLDLTTNTTLSTPGTYTTAQLDTFFQDSVFANLNGETLTIGTVSTPEPTSLLLAGVAAAPLVMGRGRRLRSA